MYVTHRFSPEIRNELKQLSQLNNWMAFVALCEDYLVICMAVVLSQWHFAFYLPAVILIGSRQRALASLLHESAHLVLAKSRKLNKLFGCLIGFHIFQSWTAYRNSHVLLHHHFLGHPDKDPDYINYIESGLYKIRDRLDFIKHIVKTLLLFNTPKYIKYLLKDRLLTKEMPVGEKLGILCTHVSAFLLFYWATDIWGYLLYWLIPYLTAFQVIGWLSEIAEHYQLFNQGASSLNITRNRFPSFYERMIIGMHGDNFHLTHHLHAGIPFWNLRKAHMVMMKDDAYKNANSHRGGIFSSSNGKSVLSEICDKLLSSGAGGPSRELCGRESFE